MQKRINSETYLFQLLDTWLHETPVSLNKFYFIELVKTFSIIFTEVHLGPCQTARDH